jgi:hypothetical protein
MIRWSSFMKRIFMILIVVLSLMSCRDSHPVKYQITITDKNGEVIFDEIVPDPVIQGPHHSFSDYQKLRITDSHKDIFVIISPEVMNYNITKKVVD